MSWIVPPTFYYFSLSSDISSTISLFGCDIIFPFMSFIRWSCPSLCLLLVVVVGAFSGSRCGLRVGVGFFGGLLVFLRGRFLFTWSNMRFAGASRLAPMF